MLHAMGRAERRLRTADALPVVQDHSTQSLQCTCIYTCFPLNRAVSIAIFFAVRRSPFSSA
jgi:hypothetical protein